MDARARNTLIWDGWVLEKLQCHEDVAAFDCGDSDLNEYFHLDSLNYRNELMTQTYCFYQLGHAQAECVALVDFCNDSLARNFISNRDRRAIHHRKRGYHAFPAAKITRLGVDRAFQGAKIGSLLLNAIKYFFITDNRTGCRFRTVDAYRNAEGFYQKNGFIRAILPEEEENPDSPTIPMFFDLKRIEL